MLAATTTLAMLIANTVAAPVTVNMGDLLEATKVDAFGKHHLWFSAIDHSTETGKQSYFHARTRTCTLAYPRVPTCTHTHTHA